jgi:hypothetical protein
MPAFGLHLAEAGIFVSCKASGNLRIQRQPAGEHVLNRCDLLIDKGKPISQFRLEVRSN